MECLHQNIPQSYDDFFKSKRKKCSQRFTAIDLRTHETNDLKWKMPTNDRKRKAHAKGQKKICFPERNDDAVRYLFLKLLVCT